MIATAARENMRTHFLVAALERFGHVDEVRQLAEFVAGYRQAQPVTPLAQCFALALVDEQMIDASVRPLLLRLLEQLVRRELDRHLDTGDAVRRYQGIRLRQRRRH